MTKQWIHCLLSSIFATFFFAATATPANAQANKHFEACQTLGGEYEERRTDCKPECKTTYICRFGGGLSRICDEQGNCEQVQDGSGDSASGADESSGQDDTGWSYEGGESFEDCVLEAGQYCRDQCDDERGYDAVECARDCVEDLEGQCEDYEFGSDDYADECTECMDLCDSACDRFRQNWRRDNCLSECRSRCNAVCD